MPTQSSLKPKISKSRFLSCFGLLLSLLLPMYFYPVEVANLLQESYTEVSRTCSFLYLLSGILCFGFIIWLSISEFGKVRLGDDDDTIEFSTSSWLGMIFCAGIGAGLMRWAAVEWAYYYLDPPHGLPAESLSATDWAMSYPLFHWGPIAWSYYCLPAIAIAYPLYVKKIPCFRYSVSLYGLLGEAGLQGPIAKTVDVLFVVSLLGGAGYSLGVSIPLISGTFCSLTGLQDGFPLQVISGLVCVLFFSCSAYLGLSKGIKRLSDWNIYLSFGLLLFVLAAGPTIFILNSSLSSLGFMAQNFLVMSTWTDPFSDSGFVANWTIFYWAWWLSYAPFVGLFVARISRGRTIRQVTLGMLIFGSGGCMLFFMILGNYAFHVERTEDAGMLSLLTTEDGGYVDAILRVLQTLPMPSLVTGVFCLICVIFCSTTYDSASYIIAATVTRKTQLTDEPAKWNRLFWAFALAALPLTIMWIDHKQQARIAETGMQSILLLTSLPIIMLLTLSAWSLTKQLAKDKIQSNPSRFKK
ncbi:BCCT family transporter [Rubripirellula sp.]|nr:BCCT family transporter [Rubripirellula sp.]MDB4419380.1 BCCT family transporter [bacterium]MDB4621986.1 BCCT family transporter [Rubripirellula sp.]MDB4645034.1 BCCT family transporter [Rubripirellula sp.]